MMPTDSHHIPLEILDRVLAGQATDAEHAMVAEWVGDDPIRTEWLAAMHGVRPRVIDVDAALARTKAVNSTQGLLRASVTPPRFQTRHLWLSLCAVALVAIGVTVTQHPATWFPTSSTPRGTMYATRPGQRARITLSNGAQALLGPATQLTMIKGTSANHGVEIALVGEALFTVAHREGTPFVVRTGHTVTRVLGTTFLVRKYADENAIRVVVRDGRVGVRARMDSTASPRVVTQEVVLGAHDAGVIRDSGRVTVTPNVSLDEVTSLASGRLVFHNVPLRQVVTELSRAYDVNLHVGDMALAEHVVTMTIPVATQSFDTVLEPLLELLDAHATRSGRVFTIVPGRPVRRETTLPHLPESSYGR